MSKFYSILFISILYTTFSFGQSNYTPASIEKKDGTDVKGFIDFKDWGRTPRFIHFKENEQDEKVKLTTDDLKSFNVNNKKYISKIVDIEVSHYSNDHWKNQNGFKIEKDTVFLEVLIDGPKSLYGLANKQGVENFYISNQNSNIELLKYKKVFVVKDGKDYQKELNHYRGQLLLFFDNEKWVNNILSKTAYKKMDLMSVFEKYYDIHKVENKNLKETYKAPDEKTKINIGVTAGVNFTNISIASTGSNSDIDMGSSTSYTFGLSFEISPQIHLQRFTLYNELGYSSYEHNAQVKLGNTISSSRFYDYDLSASMIQLTNLLRYKVYNQKQFKIFLNAGICNNFILNAKAERTRVENGSEPTDIFKGTKSYLLGGVFGYGFSINRISFENRFEWNNGLADASRPKSSTTRIGLLVSYQF
ncbi:outer membrane beta-barrel protein [Flammeovirga aprica]|uniref:PorT family protein n=1 Tax=Flammeovirga aprica JL-4 TaxID=694437 RepID=A0A7X9RZB4_9BACT|nr:outer membrane beta-barrel protein [Flammeovirga aprica]NME71450.1 PorT family protein [Flammeovirga aprica JL-4]